MKLAKIGEIINYNDDLEEILNYDQIKLSKTTTLITFLPQFQVLELVDVLDEFVKSKLLIFLGIFFTVLIFDVILVLNSDPAIFLNINKDIERFFNLEEFNINSLLVTSFISLVISIIIYIF